MFVVEILLENCSEFMVMWRLSTSYRT